MKERNDDIRIVTKPEEEDVTPKKSLKVLGWILNSRLSMDEHLQKIKMKIKFIMSSVKTITPYMSEKNRLLFANSYMIPILNYGVQIYMSEKQTTKQRYHKSMIMIGRWLKQSYCFKMSCHEMLKTLKWELPNQNQ